MQLKDLEEAREERERIVAQELLRQATSETFYIPRGMTKGMCSSWGCCRLAAYVVVEKKTVVWFLCHTCFRGTK